MERGPIGRFVTVSTAGSERVEAFLPHALPPSPPLELSGDLRDGLDRALLALGRLDSVSTLLPDTALFLYMYVRKEAVLSSQIEGTRSSLSDLLLFEVDEAPGVPLDDVQEVSNYVRCITHGLERIRGGFPLSNRLFRELHAILLSEGRGSHQQPGEFRLSQNWVGGPRPGLADYVPPPAQEVLGCMGDLETFLHDQPDRTPTLLKAALAHVQFETIHPFLDGNGRLGRLMIPLLLCAEGVLQEPLLYLSLYFKEHRSAYYEHLQRVRRTGDWETWIEFFVLGVLATAEGAVQTARDLVALIDRDRARIESLGRPSGSALRVHHALQQSPVLTIARASAATGLTAPTVSTAIAHLEKLGIARELTGRRWNRLYGYGEYLQILSRSTETGA